VGAFDDGGTTAASTRSAFFTRVLGALPAR
jgi:hypothetical protein